MSRFSEKLIAALLVMFLLVTVAYQVYLAVYASTKTETVYEYTVARSIPVTGIAIRSETLIEGDFSGIENFIHEDGTRVTAGEKVAEFYESDYSDKNLRRARELESEIRLLGEASDSVVNNLSTAESLNRDIKEKLSYLSKLSNSKRYSSVADVRSGLTVLINKRQVATGVATDFTARIEELQNELKQLDYNPDDAFKTSKAPVSGYFSKNVDGRETELSPAEAAKFGVNDYLSAIDRRDSLPPESSLGKIITTPNWIFAAAAPAESLEFVKPGQEVSLTFEAINKKIPATVREVLSENGAERGVLLLSCNQVSGSLLSLRKAQAVINFDQYTGLRVNISEVRFSGEKRGVYVLEGNTVKFKEINPIYEEASFVLSGPAKPNTQDETSSQDEASYIGLFDQIIKGKDLYDGKVLQ